jgi:hypothetical protein
MQNNNKGWETTALTAVTANVLFEGGVYKC